jgi:hypothetical protein
MKNNKIILLAIALLSICIACKKYPDGPRLGLLGKANRFSSIEKIDAYIYDGVDITSQFTGSNYSVSASGTYFAYYERVILGKTYKYQADNGEWAFTDNDNKVIMSANAKDRTFSTTTYTILKLKSGAVWLQTTDSVGKEIIIHFSKK